MKAKSASSTHLVVTHLKAVAWLTNMDNLKVLEPFISKALTISQAAEKLDLTLNKMYKTIKGLENLGLIQAVREEKRKGRSQRFYQASAKEFFIHSTDLSIDGFLNGLATNFEQQLTKGFEGIWEEQKVMGHRIYLEKDGGISIRAASGPGVNWTRSSKNPALFNMWLTPSLDYEDANALQKDLQIVWDKYRYKKGSQRYIVRLAMVASSE
jgi:predicted transcriptional regulator